MFGQENPFSRNGTYHLNVIRVVPGKVLRAILWGDPVASFVHFSSGKSLPCTQPQLENCPLCEKEIPRRYYAWYPVKGLQGGKGLLEITAAAEEQMISQLRDVEENELVEIEVYRGDKRKNAPLLVRVHPRKVSAEEFKMHLRDKPCEIATRATLLNLWGVPHPREGESEIDWLKRVRLNLLQRI
jgi:hypothetical protein